MTTGTIPVATANLAIGDSYVSQQSGGGIGPDYLYFNDPSGTRSSLRVWGPLGVGARGGDAVSQFLFTSGAVANHLVKMGGAGSWIAAGTTDTNVAVFPVISTQCAGGVGTCYVPQIEGIAIIADDGTACTPGHTVVASSTVAGTIHDTGSTSPPSGVFVVGVCAGVTSPDIIILTPSFH
jgi:hypothetical protein